MYSVGLGLGIALTPSVMAIGGYFVDPNQHRLAVGVAATGSSLGVAIFPLLIYHLEDVYAWKGVVVLLVAVCAHLLPCGATIRPLNPVNGTRPRRWKNVLKIFEPVLFRSVAFDVLLLSNLFWSAGASIVVFFLPEYALSTGNKPTANNRVTTCLENLEMSGNLKHVREMSGMLLTVRELSGKKSCHGKVSQNCSLLDEY